MSKNIFLDSQQYVAKQKRNSYDVSKLVNGTYKEGFLYPVYWKELSFGESIRLDLSAALRTMPMVFPIQTPILVKFYNFFTPYRVLWKNFEEFRFNNKQFVHPYIAIPNTKDFWATGNLADHMGIPSTLSRPGLNTPLSLSNPIPIALRDTYPPLYRSNISNFSLGQPFNEYFSLESSSTFNRVSRYFGYPHLTNEMLSSGKFSIRDSFFTPDSLGSGSVGIMVVCDNFPDLGRLVLAYQSCSFVHNADTGFCDVVCNSGSLTSNNYFIFSGADTTHGIFNYLKSFITHHSSNSDFDSCTYSLVVTDATNNASLDPSVITSSPLDLRSVFFNVGDSTLDITDVANPFSGSNAAVPLSSLPFRAYEAIYRSHFQDTIVEPFIIDGEAQYNRYVTNLDDGADSTDYHLFRCNYEADFLTSARPSPQQGLAPLVGITSAGDITLINSEGNEYSVRVTTSDGDIIDGIDLATERGDKDSSVRRTLLDLASSGFSINALRNTNAFQRWIETNYRRSLRYKDQVFSHTGVKLSYKELDMPEFLGGFTIPLDVNTVTQMSSSVQDSPLGQLGANGGAFGRAKHNISYYAEDEGVFMTLMCIRPIPVYSQILSRDWLKSTPVDYYNPEFGKIGNQPITYEEVCPVQAYNEGVPLTDVFGYQRPWYWRISAVDEVHGLFRTTMSSFLQQRVFGSTPKLSADFLHINQEKMTDVFVITDEDKSDPFYGQIGIKAYIKSSTPRKNVPSLE